MPVTLTRDNNGVVHVSGVDHSRLPYAVVRPYLTVQEQRTVGRVHRDTSMADVLNRVCASAIPLRRWAEVIDLALHAAQQEAAGVTVTAGAMRGAVLAMGDGELYQLQLIRHARPRATALAAARRAVLTRAEEQAQAILADAAAAADARLRDCACREAALDERERQRKSQHYMAWDGDWALYHEAVYWLVPLNVTLRRVVHYDGAQIADLPAEHDRNGWRRQYVFHACIASGTYLCLAESYCRPDHVHSGHGSTCLTLPRSYTDLDMRDVYNRNRFVHDLTVQLGTVNLASPLVKTDDYRALGALVPQLAWAPHETMFSV